MTDLLDFVSDMRDLMSGTGYDQSKKIDERDWQKHNEYTHTYRGDPRSPLGLVRRAPRRKTSTFQEQMCGVNERPAVR